MNTPLAAAAHPSTTYLPYIVGIIGVIFGGGGLAALRKSGPEGSQIVVSAAEGAVVVQTGVITSLRAELERAQGDLTKALTELAEMRGRYTELTELREENGELRREQSRLKRENEVLTRRVAELEAVNARHDGQSGASGPQATV